MASACTGAHTSFWDDRVNSSPGNSKSHVTGSSSVTFIIALNSDRPLFAFILFIFFIRECRLTPKYEHISVSSHGYRSSLTSDWIQFHSTIKQITELLSRVFFFWSVILFLLINISTLYSLLYEQYVWILLASPFQQNSGYGKNVTKMFNKIGCPFFTIINIKSFWNWLQSFWMDSLTFGQPLVQNCHINN